MCHIKFMAPLYKNAEMDIHTYYISQVQKHLGDQLQVVAGSTKVPVNILPRAAG